MPTLGGGNGHPPQKVEHVNGIIFGKFLPPHLGHEHCIEIALGQ